MSTNILNTSSTTIHNNSDLKTFKGPIVSDEYPEVIAIATEQGRVTCPTVKELSDVEDQVDNSGEDGCDEQPHREDKKDECYVSQEATGENEITEKEPPVENSPSLEVEKEGEEASIIESGSIEGTKIVPFLPFGGFLNAHQHPLLPSPSDPRDVHPSDGYADPSIILESLKLTPCQMRAIVAVREGAKVMYSTMSLYMCFAPPFALPQRVADLGFTMDDIKK